MSSDMSKQFPTFRNYIHRPSAGHEKLCNHLSKHFFPLRLPWLNNLPQQTKERPTQPLDAHGFPDICASTSTAGQAVGNDGAGGYSGGSETPCATPIVHLVSREPDSCVYATHQCHPSLGHRRCLVRLPTYRPRYPRRRSNS